MKYLSCFDFGIRHVKGKLNKAADALSCYYQFNQWDEALLVQHYVFVDVRLDPDHEDLPWDRHLEIRNKMIEAHSTQSQASKQGNR